jgi:hypothetical protein
MTDVHLQTQIEKAFEDSAKITSTTKGTGAITAPLGSQREYRRLRRDRPRGRSISG